MDLNGIGEIEIVVEWYVVWFVFDFELYVDDMVCVIV